MKLLILESSTTSAKAMLYDAESDKWRIATKPYGFAQDSNGTHDGEAVFLKTVQAAKEIADGGQVDIILQSTTWHSLALADKTGALWDASRRQRGGQGRTSAAPKNERRINKSAGWEIDVYAPA